MIIEVLRAIKLERKAVIIRFWESFTFDLKTADLKGAMFNSLCLCFFGTLETNPRTVLLAV